MKETWRKGTFSGCEETALKPDSREFTISYYTGNESGWHENDVRVTFTDDKALYFSSPNSESFIYLYPEQVPYLEELLKKWREGKLPDEGIKTAPGEEDGEVDNKQVPEGTD